MSSFQIKLLACFFMLIDHLGVILFPDQLFWRVIGRLSFPLFAWSIANGFFYTHDLRRYLQRLFFFGLLIQLPYSLYFHSWELNIFFTLSLGLAAIWLFDRTANKGFGFLLVFLIAGLGDAVQADYGSYGVLTIFIFYYCREDFRKLVSTFLLLNLLRFLAPLISGMGVAGLSDMDYIQPISAAALAMIYFYNGQKGRSWKYLFYIFYPGHLLILYGIKLLLA